MVSTDAGRHAPFNAALDLLAPNLAAGRGDKTAYIDDYGRYSYAELDRQVRKAATALLGLGLTPEQRVLLCMHDSFALPVVFLGAIRAGIVPVLTNTLLMPDDYVYMLNDCRAKVAIVSTALVDGFPRPSRTTPHLQQLVLAGGNEDQLRALLKASDEQHEVATTCGDEPCFWLYSSGSTGRPKGTVHVHSSMRATAELYAGPILGINENDLVFSAAKLFFAYGLGNALSFPLSVGATTLLMAERPTPEAVFKRLVSHRASIFYGVPTLYAGLLASPVLPPPGQFNLRRCTSAGEALPEDIGRRWREHFGLDILDGIGSTEMLHIFLSNRPDDVRPGTTGTAVPGYELRLLDDDDHVIVDEQIGELQVRGPTAASMYWNNRERSRKTFVGEWTRTGDKYRRDEDGYYVYCGRSDDMLKVGGIYVSPTEVENALVSHPAVLEAAVVGRADGAGLIKPQAFVVLNSGQHGNAELAAELQSFVKTRLAPYKYPRWVEFCTDLPKTATGKIQRFKLREG